MRTILLTLTLALTTLAVSAQKFGHINTQELLLELPAYTQAKAELDLFIQEQQTEFQTHASFYQKKEAKYLELEKQCQSDAENCDKDALQLEYKYLMESAEKLEQLQYDMELKIQEKENFLINRVVNKIKSAAEAVAKEKGIIYVFDSNQMIYAGGEDLNDAVKAKLGGGTTTTGGQ